jgi:hypothetical protein
MSKTQTKGRSVEELVGAMSAQLEKIVEKLQETNNRLDQQEARFDKLETFLRESREENKELKEQLRIKNVEVKQLQQKVNDIEQHNRSYNVRIFNLPIEGDKADTRNVMKQVFTKLLSPILQGAVDRGRLHSLPGVEVLLETAHILPGKEDKPNPIICRFFNRYHRTLVLQLKKDFAPRMVTTGSNRLPPYLYQIFEDVTADTFRMMRAISNHPDVTACWASGGHLRYRIKDSDVIHRVSSVYDAIEDIIKPK